jgi:3-oxoacyl-[acyl-carrier-protein] synthase II
MSVVITSMGVVTGFGLGLERTVFALLDGRSAIRTVTRFPTAGLCSSLASEAPQDDALVSASSAYSQFPAPDRASRLLLAALADALQGRTLDSSPRRGVVVGTTKGALERAVPDWERGILSTEDFLGSPARALAAATTSHGPVFTVGAACASSAVALGEAVTLIEDGLCDEVLVGGTEALHPFLYEGFHALKALSARPTAPFDAERNGLSLGEGAVVLLVESLAHSRRCGRGLLAACRRALTHAGVTAEEIDRYHAHGTGTLQNDSMEAAVHRSLFGSRLVPVCAIKGAIGHTLGASAALDIALCVETLGRHVLPPVVNLRTLDAAASVPAVMSARRSDGTLALVASAGFGGINTAVVLRRPETS